MLLLFFNMKLVNVSFMSYFLIVMCHIDKKKCRLKFEVNLQIFKICADFLSEQVICRENKSVAKVKKKRKERRLGQDRCALLGQATDSETDQNV